MGAGNDVIGTVLSDRYQITGEIGRGGMGVVYRGHDPLLRREVAIKMISPSVLEDGSEEQIRSEAQLVAKLDHPAIVPIHDLGRHEGALYLVMPLIEGETLRRRIERGDLRLGDVLEIGVQAAQALGYSHSQGVVHRDIKPSNMMLGEHVGTLRLRIMDFGIARRTEDNRRTQTTKAAGTLAYLGPEQVDDPKRPPDGRSDLYSLGVVLYECLAGEPPFVGSVFSTLYRIVHEQPRGLRQRGVEIDEELESVILSCLAKEPVERPPSGRELARRLARYRDRLAESQWARSTLPRRPSSGEPMLPLAESLPLVGRAREMERLSEVLDEALSGTCRLVVVGGEAGVGKSRLLQELEHRARARRVRVLHGQFSDWETSFPYQGLSELIQDFYRSRGSSTSFDIPALPDMSDLASDLVAMHPALSEIPELGAALSPGYDPAGSGERRISNPTYVFDLLARALGRLASGMPLVILLENLHAAEVALEALQYLVRRLGPTPTLVVGTYRSTEVYRGHPLDRFFDAFKGDPRLVRMMLGPLDPGGLRELIAHLLGSNALSESLVRRIAKATEGNPLFCRELLQSLRETGGVRLDAGRVWTLVDDSGPLARELPVTIQQAEERRIERLASDQRRVLTTAAVLGRQFLFEDLESLLETRRGLDIDTDRIVDELVVQGLLREEKIRREERLAFSSGVLRDLLYQELSRRRRRRLHRRFAQILEERFAGRLERAYPQLVDHYRAADEPEKTVFYGLALARVSLDTFAAEDAIRAARIALEFVEDEEEEVSRRHEAELAEVLARAYQYLGQTERAARHAEQAVEAFSKVRAAEAERASAALLAAEIAWRSRRMDQVRYWVDRGLENARRGGCNESLTRLVDLGATVANLRGEQSEAVYLEEIKNLELAGEDRRPELHDGRLVSAFANPVRSLDPPLGETLEEWEITACLYETLLVTDTEGVVGAGLADYWELSADGRELMLRLRSGVRFSDGSLLDGAAVKASLERALLLGRRSLPPALSAVEGLESFLAAEAPDVAGIRVEESSDGRERVRLHLREPLPILPVLLSDPRTAIVKTAVGPLPYGTGPFRAKHQSPGHFVLEPSPLWRGARPHLASLEIRIFDDAWAIAAALEAEEVDLARDLLPDDLEQLLRRPRYRGGLVEETKKNTYFLLFNPQGPTSRSPVLRRAMVDVVRVRDLVWRTLGRFAMPAVSLIPPGVLGHDAGRRREHTDLESLRRSLVEAGFELPLRVRIVVHPLFHERFADFMAELTQCWRSIGIELEIVNRTIDELSEIVASPEACAEIDLVLLRWGLAYDDPDNFTYAIFNSGNGLLRHVFSSTEADLLMQRARLEKRAGSRVRYYQRFENMLDEEALLLPLFHDVDYRLAAPGWGGIRLEQRPPFVSYAEIGRLDESRIDASLSALEGGELHIPSSLVLESLDPTRLNLVDIHEMSVNVFETLTRIDDRARVLPWLAESFEPLIGGRAYRFRLRRDVRFHDGRRLTTRDVRHSFERLLERESDAHFLLHPIRGARSMAEGKADKLAGFKILSPEEMVLELHWPLAFFPALLTHPATSILPEGTGHLGSSWRDGACGTGPFRLTRIEAGREAVLERHPHYWRTGFPKAERLVFRCYESPAETLRAFRHGELSLASGLLPADVERMRRSPELRGDFAESPSLSTYYLALATRHGPLADPAVRQTLAECLDLDSPVAELGRLASRAHCLVPPGLLGHEAPRDHRVAGASDHDRLRSAPLRLAEHPIYDTLYAGFRDRLIRSLVDLGVEIEIVRCEVTDLAPRIRRGEVDLVLSRWMAVYPDADCFMTGLFDPRNGALSALCGSPEIEQWVEKGRRETDPALRHGIYRTIEDMLARENRILPLFHLQTYRFAGSKTRGLQLGITVPEVRYEELSVVEVG